MSPKLVPTSHLPELHLHLMPFNVFQEPKGVVILILDANDNIPMFDNSSYDCTIPEVSPLKDASNVFLVCSLCKQFIWIQYKLATGH